MTTQPYYETMYILRPDIPEDEVDKHLSKYSEILVKAGGEVLDNQMRGKRRLAYPIAKHKEGIYVQLSHKGNGEHIAIFEKAMRLSEDIIRYMTVKQDGPLPVKKSPKNNEKEDKTESLEETKNKQESVNEKGKEESKVEEKGSKNEETKE
tara:strand:+ start:94 stop:546 length:453 start_codon:yes stop_codon:yes gene_type:complete